MAPVAMVVSPRPERAGQTEGGTTTILPREGERSRESACLQCAFTPLAGPEDDKDGQETWFTARIASLIG